MMWADADHSRSRTGRARASPSRWCAHGVRDEIVVVDRRTEFGRDRTWCTWAVPGDAVPRARHAPLGRRGRSPPDGHRARRDPRARPYVHIASDDFYAAALEELDRAPNVELRLGDAGAPRSATAGRAPTRGPPRRAPSTTRSRWAARRCADVEIGAVADVPGLGGAHGGAALRSGRRDADGLPTPSRSADGVQFLYVLPFAPTARSSSTRRSRAAGLAPTSAERALRAVPRCEHEILHEERGRLPMTTAPPRRRCASAAHDRDRRSPAGRCGASSGYAFTRVQAHATALARAIAARGAAARARRRAAPRALDAVFIHALRRSRRRSPSSSGRWSSASRPMPSRAS